MMDSPNKRFRDKNHDLNNRLNHGNNINNSYIFND